MKNFAFTALVALIPTLAVAQGVSVGVHGGVLYNTAPKNANATAVKSYGSVRVYKDVNAVTLGFCLDVGSLDGNTNVQFIDSASKKPQYFDYTEKYARYFVMPNLSVNIRIPLPKSYGYYGGNIGYMFGQTDYMEAVTLYSIAKFRQSTNGASIGLHAGYVLNAGDKLSIALEAAGRYVSIGRNRYGIFYFPLSAGLQYNF